MDSIKIIVVKNPLDVVRGRVTAEIPFKNQSLKSLIKKYAPELDEVIVRINGTKIKPTAKNKYEAAVYPGDEILILPAVRDPVSAITAVAAWAAPAIVTAAINMAIAYGIGAIVRAIGGSPEDADIDSAPAFSWSPVTIQRQGTTIPRAYGTNKQYGNIIGNWRTPDGTDETLNMLVAFGAGPDYGIVADTVYINNQPAGNYDSITTYERKGTMSQTAIFSSLKCEYQPEVEVINVGDGGEAITWTTPDNDFDWLEIAVKYSGHYVHKDGGVEVQYVGVKIEISAHDADDWYTLANESLGCTAQTIMQKNYISTGTYTGGAAISITKGTRCDIRVTKTNVGRVWDSNRKSRYLYLSTVREVINTAFSYPGLSMLGVSALATESISGSLQISAIRKGRICNVYNGSSWSLAWTDNPAWVIFDIMTRPVITGDGGGTAYAISRYDGINPARLTEYLDDWYEAAAYFDELISDGQGGSEKRMIFNGVFDEPSDVWKCVNRVCAMCRSEVIRIGRDYTILVDKPVTASPVQMFSAGNIKAGSYRKNYINIEDRAGELQMDYIDSDLDYEMTPMVHVDSLIDSGLSKTVSGFGITRATQAWRALYYELSKNRIIKYMAELEADVDAIACRKGDIVYVVEPWRFGGRVVTSTAADKVTLDAEPTTTAADTVAVRVNHPDTGAETVETKTVASVSGAVVTVTGTWTVRPKKGDLYAFGPTAEILKKFRVVGITQSDD